MKNNEAIVQHERVQQKKRGKLKEKVATMLLLMELNAAASLFSSRFYGRLDWNKKILLFSILPTSIELLKTVVKTLIRSL